MKRSLVLPMPTKKAPPPAAVYQLKVTLKGIRPPIWRRVLVPDNIVLAQLHAVVQTVMGWEDSHMHSFKIEGLEYGEPSIDSYVTVKDERRFTLGELVTKVKAKFLYTYDFGDNWEHELQLEEILPVVADQRLPVCVTGKRAGPPENVGGAWGYQALLEARDNPRHPERQNFAELIASYDPNAFDVAAINARLRKLK
jgi:hypothetical protein